MHYATQREHPQTLLRPPNSVEIRKHFTYKYIDLSLTRFREEITRISIICMYYRFKGVSRHQRQINTMM